MTYTFADEQSWEEHESTQSWRELEKPHAWDPISTSSPPGAVEAANEAQQLLVIKETGAITSHYHPGTYHASFSVALTLRCFSFIPLLSSPFHPS